MALATPLSTCLDVRNWREEIYADVRDDKRILSAIFRGDSIIRARLRDHYTLDDDFESSSIWNGPPQARLEVGDQNGNSGSGSLLDITPASTARTQQWEVTFSSTTAFSVNGTLSGSEGSGTTASNFISSDAEITIPSANWSGTPASGDVIYISVYKHRPLVVTLSSMYAAFFISSELFRGERGMPPEVEILKNQVDEILNALCSPYDDSGLRLDSFSERDITPEGLQYTISVTGQDISPYSDNEQTPWTDSQLFNFLNGPVWL